MQKFVVHSDFSPSGDQPQAIEAISRSLRNGDRFNTLLGVTGSGKTFTLANVIAEVQRPTLVLSHNKTLAAQLFSELKSFFPENAVEYFVSYYDYYQPEAYIPQTDTYIAKDSSINDELEKLRLAATSSLLSRRDVIVVASVSCIYGLGSPEDFEAMQARLEIDGDMDRDDLLRRLVDIQYTRNDVAPGRGEFRAAGDTVDIYPSYRDDFIRIEFWGSTVDRMTQRDSLTNEVLENLQDVAIFPAKHFVMPSDRVKEATPGILAELDEQVAKFERENKLVEAQRLHQRTMYDLEMLREIGYCQGVENYSRHLSNREPGSRPYTLIDYFPENFLTVVDESHVTLPQVRAMFNADRNRKIVLVDNGFRLPSALDNRPLAFAEFEDLQNSMLFISATPGEYELERSQPVQQVIRPTGLLDPEIEVRPLATQVDDVIHEIRIQTEKKERVLVTTLTKRTAEDLADYLRDLGLRARYLHSDLDAIERVEILRSLRAGDFDCLVGINLLREGLDLPEVSLIAVLDADKEGFLRSETSLLQTAGRAARNEKGRVIFYADKITDSMRKVIQTTRERRTLQEEYNREHDITPKTIKRAIQSSLYISEKAEETVASMVNEEPGGFDLSESILSLEKEMLEAAEALEFERAAMLRDQIKELRSQY